MLKNHYINGRWWAKCISTTDFPLISWWTKYWHRDGTFHWTPASEWPAFDPADHEFSTHQNVAQEQELAQQSILEVITEINAMNLWGLMEP